LESNYFAINPNCNAPAQQQNFPPAVRYQDGYCLNGMGEFQAHRQIWCEKTEGRFGRYFDSGLVLFPFVGG